MKIERFEDIEAWQHARVLTQKAYAVTAEGGFARDFRLGDQIRDAAGSVMHNIAEGFDGGSNTEFARFLSYAQRSCAEVQSQLYVALDQSYPNESEYRDLYDLAAQTRSKIGGFIRYLKSNPR